MPRCFGALGSVRTSRIHQSACIAPLPQDLLPVDHKVIPIQDGFV